MVRLVVETVKSAILTAVSASNVVRMTLSVRAYVAGNINPVQKTVPVVTRTKSARMGLVAAQPRVKLLTPHVSAGAAVEISVARQINSVKKEHARLLAVGEAANLGSSVIRIHKHVKPRRRMEHRALGVSPKAVSGEH
jgi:hypothetical protein